MEGGRLTWLHLMPVLLLCALLVNCVSSQGSKDDDTLRNKADCKLKILEHLDELLRDNSMDSMETEERQKKRCEKMLSSCENRFELCDSKYVKLMTSFSNEYKNLQKCILDDKQLHDTLCNCKTEKEKCTSNLECCENNLETCECALEGCNIDICNNDLEICEDNCEKCECDLKLCENNILHCENDVSTCNNELNDCETKIGDLHTSIEICLEMKDGCHKDFTDCLKNIDNCNKLLCNCNEILEDCEEEREECEEQKVICEDLISECEANFTDCNNTLGALKDECNLPFVCEEERDKLCAYEDGVYYIATSPVTSYSAAEDACTKMNGKLISVSSAADYDYYVKMLSTCGKSGSSNMLICQQDREVEDSYVCNGAPTTLADISGMFDAVVDPVANDCLVLVPNVPATSTRLLFVDCMTGSYRFACKITSPCAELLGITPITPPKIC